MDTRLQAKEWGNVEVESIFTHNFGDYVGSISEWSDLLMDSDKALFLQIQQNFVPHLKRMWHLMLIMSWLVLGIGIFQDVMKPLVDVMDAFNKCGSFISLTLYMCVFCRCSCMRHGNINHTQWLKSQTKLKGTATNQAMESSVIDVLYIENNFILGSWMLGVVHAK